MKKVLISLLVGTSLFGVNGMAKSATIQFPIEYGTNYNSYSDYSPSTINGTPLPDMESDGKNTTPIASSGTINIGDNASLNTIAWSMNDLLFSGYELKNNNSFSLLRVNMNNQTNDYNEIKQNQIISAKLYLTAVGYNNTNSIAEGNIGSPDYAITYNQLPEYNPSQNLYYTSNDNWYSPVSDKYINDNGDISGNPGLAFPDLSDAGYLATSKVTVPAVDGIGTISDVAVWDITGKFSDLISDPDGILSFLLKNDPSINFAAPDLSLYTSPDSDINITNSLGYNLSYTPLYLEIVTRDDPQSPAPTPEPSSMVLGFLSFSGLLGIRKRNR